MSAPAQLPGFLQSLAPLLDRWGYIGIAFLLFVEDFGVPAPGETVLIAASVYAGAGRLNIFAVAIVAFGAAILGDNTGYAIGRFGGRALVLRYGRYVRLTPERLEKAESFFDRHGGKIIVVARFVEGLRQANGIIAGTSGMRWLKFLLFNAIGAALWVATWTLTGYFAGNHIETIYHGVARYSLYILGAAVVLVVALVIRHRRHRTAASAEKGDDGAKGVDEGNGRTTRRMDETQLVFGTEVRCADGACGRLRRVVIDAVENVLTHLAVEPNGSQSGRLVPADEVVSAGSDILLRCGLAEYAQFQPAQESGGTSWPYSPDEPAGRFPAGVEGIEQDTGYGNLTSLRDRIPAGGTEVRRGELVFATDGEVGRVQGLTVDLKSRQVIRLLLDKGRLRGRTRIAIPIGSVQRFGDGIQLDLPKDQVGDLPPAPSGQGE